MSYNVVVAWEQRIVRGLQQHLQGIHWGVLQEYRVDTVMQSLYCSTSIRERVRIPDIWEIKSRRAS